MAKHVYVVTIGCAVDDGCAHRRLTACFPSEAKAQRYVAEYLGSARVDIEEVRYYDTVREVEDEEEESVSLSPTASL